MQTEFAIDTPGPGMTEFTGEVAAWVAGQGDGLLTLLVRHTSASLLIQENADPDVRRDLDAFFARLVPPADEPAMSYLVHRSEGPDDMPAHIKSVMIGPSLTLPISHGHLALGTWQGIYVCEHRDNAGSRKIVATLQGRW